MVGFYLNCTKNEKIQKITKKDLQKEKRSDNIIFAARETIERFQSI